MAKAKQLAASVPVDGPWAIPDGWRWEALGGLGKWTGGGTPSKARADFWNGGTIPWVSPKDMKRPLIDSSENMITADAVVGSSAKMVNRGSVLCVTRSGILRHTFPVAVNLIDVTLNQDMRALTPRDDVNPRYLAYYLELSGQTVLDTASKGGTTVNSIEVTRFDRHPVPIPGLDTQQLIVARIEELLAEIGDGEAALGRAREDLGTWRMALLKAAVTGELTADWRVTNPPTETGADLLARILVERRARWDGDPVNQRKRYKEPAPANAEKLAALPDGWLWATMEQLSWASGYGSSEKCSAEAGGTPVLRIPNIRGGVVRFDNMKFTVSPMDLRDGNAVDVGDLLIIRTNGSEDLIGRAALVMTRPDVMTYFASYLIRLRLLGPRQLLRWIAVLVNSPVFRAAVLRSIASSAGQFNLNLTKIEGFALPIPPIDEVEVAISRFEAAEDQANAGAGSATEATDTAASLRQAILAAAFRGELA